MSFLLTLFLSTLDCIQMTHYSKITLKVLIVHLQRCKQSKDNSVDFQTLRKLENTQNTGKVEVKL